MPQGTRRRIILASLLFVPVTIGSCVPRTLDASQLERRLGRELSDELGIPGVTVRCPSDVEVRRGEAFRCTARAPGEPRGLAIRVTQIDEDGRVTWEIAGAAE